MTKPSPASLQRKCPKTKVFHLGITPNFLLSKKTSPCRDMDTRLVYLLVYLFVLLHNSYTKNNPIRIISPSMMEIQESRIDNSNSKIAKLRLAVFPVLSALNNKIILFRAEGALSSVAVRSGARIFECPVSTHTSNFCYAAW